MRFFRQYKAHPIYAPDPIGVFKVQYYIAFGKHEFELMEFRPFEDLLEALYNKNPYFYQKESIYKLGINYPDICGYLVIRQWEFLKPRYQHITNY